MSSRDDDDRQYREDTPAGESAISSEKIFKGKAGTTLAESEPSNSVNPTNADIGDRELDRNTQQVSTVSDVSFPIALDLVSESGHNVQAPSLTRRKSSMATVESRLRSSALAEKHVTIVDGTENLAGAAEEGVRPEVNDELEDKSKDEETKQELAKILMQFDPLAESKQQNEDVMSEDESMSKNLQPFTEQSLSTEVPSASPNLSLSSSSSPTTPQQLDSPRTSHDLQVAMSEKARSSLKKRGDKQKSPLARRSDSVADISSRSEPPKPKEIPFDFHKFLEQMRHRSAVPITRFFQSFLKEFDKKPWTVNEQIKIIHDFLDFITGKMEICELWKNATDQEFENVKEGMEKLVMNRLFAYTFSPSTTDDAERDEVLSQKIRIFRWIREEHLDIPHSSHNEAYLNNAQAELKKINSYKAPRDKVICILNCCKFIFTLIRRSEGNSKGADTFLPILIYVVLRSNPPNLVSNVQYISRFRNPDKLQAEAGYYLASLMGAISFIENLEASSLSISLEEFDQQIEKTMAELSREKEVAMAAADTTSGGSTSTNNAPAGPGSAAIMGHRKQESKLATLVAGTAATRASRQYLPPTDEKRYLTAEISQQEKAGMGPQKQQQPQPSRVSPSPSGSSILNPAAALIERGANFATKTMQKPLDLIEKMFQDNGDEEEMAKPYPSRPPQQQYQQYQQQESAIPVRPEPQRDNSFSEFVYVPAGQQPQQSSPQQPLAFYQQQQQQEYPGNVPRARQRTVSGPQQPYPPYQPQQVPQQQQKSREEYLQALEALTDMFPSCEREVCDVILQANDGRLSPSIDTLLGETADRNAGFFRCRFIFINTGSIDRLVA
ncbi:hypothetical protein BGX28_004048 [Mortierella sp. GBA30]|nr:hypothetical protein BGX28_004048 [Mortierella sp. GBA30]